MVNLENIKNKIKFIGFFLIGLYSYIHRAFVCYKLGIEVIANFFVTLLFRHDQVVIHVAGKWDLNALKTITYILHISIVLFLYFLLF